MITDFIWDFDGMLFDTYPHTTAVLCEYFRRHGREISPEEAFSKLKISIVEAFRFYNMPEEGKEEFYEIENDLDFLPRGVPYEGIPEILRLIKEKGGRNYIYTHRDCVAVKYLELYSLDGLFTDFITMENGFPYKPAPDALEFLIKKHDLDKDCCLMLGDRAIDCKAGLSAGIKALLFDEFHNLRDCEYTYYTESIYQVRERVSSLMK
ncbi:MAG: HAD-IA family hydrolase [Clostridia bacterium]|nr:HAD-IA family hydrolase [Clostridia bacterium]